MTSLVGTSTRFLTSSLATNLCKKLLKIWLPRSKPYKPIWKSSSSSTRWRISTASPSLNTSSRNHKKPPYGSTIVIQQSIHGIMQKQSLQCQSPCQVLIPCQICEQAGEELWSKTFYIFISISHPWRWELNLFGMDL